MAVPSRSRKRGVSAVGAKLFVILIPLWLLGIIWPTIYGSDNMFVVQFVLFIWLPIAGICIGRGPFLFGNLFRERNSIFAWTAITIFAISLSALLSEEPGHSFGFVVTAALGLFSCVGVWEIVGRQMSRCLSIYAYLGTALMGYIYFFGIRVQDRLSIGEAHPNFVGLVSFGILVTALAVRPRIVASLLIAFNLLIIIETQSRSALAAALLALLVYGALKVNQIGRRKAAFVLAAISLLCAVLLLVYYDATQELISSLFFLNDKNRGLGTGFTGRVAAWREAMALFFENPVLGVGFRMHERYMTILPSAHNGYLSLLAEVGILGTVPLFTLTGLLCSRLIRRALNGDAIAMLGFSFVSGYLLIAAFERLFLNMGNPSSVLAWIFLLVADWARSPRRVRASGSVLLRTRSGWPRESQISKPTFT